MPPLPPSGYTPARGPKQRPITSSDRPGLPIFQRATLKNWARPGYEASYTLGVSLVPWPSSQLISLAGNKTREVLVSNVT